jgi:hypothetical protein
MTENAVARQALHPKGPHPSEGCHLVGLPNPKSLVFFAASSHDRQWPPLGSTSQLLLLAVIFRPFVSSP